MPVDKSPAFLSCWWCLSFLPVGSEFCACPGSTTCTVAQPFHAVPRPDTHRTLI